MAFQVMLNGWVGYDEMLRLTEHLPTSLRDFQESEAGEHSRSCLFNWGEYVHATPQE